MESSIFPKVSIIIPVYNVEQYLEDCLLSVIQQTLADIEIICINDGSTDNSFEILKNFRKSDSRINIINNSENRGQSYARNVGLKYAQGEYIYFLDSDDMITINAIEGLYNIAKNNKLDVVYFEASLIFEKEQLKNKFFGYKFKRKYEYNGIFTGIDLFSKFIENGDWVTSVPRQFWNKKHLLDNSLYFYEKIIHEDELFSFLSIMSVKRAACLNEQYFVRRFRENSTMTIAISKKNLIGYFICFCYMIEFWNNNDFDDRINLLIAKHISNLFKAIERIYKSIGGSICLQDIQEVSQDSTTIKHLFQLLISNFQGRRTCFEIEESKISVIKIYKKVIIYGAGVVAKEVLEILDKNEIELFCFAVTDKIGNPNYVMGHTVYAIDELIEYRKEAIVLVAVTQKYQESINTKLKQLEFENIMFVL